MLFKACRFSSGVKAYEKAVGLGSHQAELELGMALKGQPIIGSDDEAMEPLNLDPKRGEALVQRAAGHGLKAPPPRPAREDPYVANRRKSNRFSQSDPIRSLLYLLRSIDPGGC